VSTGYAAGCSAIRVHVEDLVGWLAIWEARTEPHGHVRRCASDAVDAIDAALAELHSIRARLIGEIRVSDDASAERTDALLRQLRDRDAGAAVGRPR
jgi:hypothetical protein